MFWKTLVAGIVIRIARMAGTIAFLADDGPRARFGAPERLSLRRRWGGAA